MANYVTLQEIREQAGFQYKARSEDLNPSEGDGTNKIFYVLNKPIVDRNYSGSPVSVADVVVYASGSPVTVSDIDADLGKLTLSDAPASGTPMTCDYDWSPMDSTVLEKYANEAHALVLNAIGGVYSLPLSEVPDLIKLIEKVLAAGLILDKEYSVGGDETEDTRGRRWVKWAEQKLADIKSGALTLRDSSGNVLSQLSEVSVDGWPDETTKDLEEEDSGGDIVQRIKKEF